MLMIPVSSPTLLRDFWRGLTTPAAAVPRVAVVLLLAALAGLSVAAENFRRRIESGDVAPQSMRDDFCRASIVAMRGAAREADPTAPTFVFVGPSAMRDWLPPDDEVDEVATAAAGGPVRVIWMCGPRQGMASSAALIDRFGADFDGWFVVGVTRQLIACRQSDALEARRRRDTQELGFDSDVQRAASAILGHEQHRKTGWELWDRRRFYYHALFKPAVRLPWGVRWLRKGKPPAGGRLEAEMDAIGPLDIEQLDRHLAVMQEVVERVRGHGRARIALVETPWEEHLLSSLQSPEWLRDEAAYRRRMREWSEKNDVPWITAADDFQATSADFKDSRHVSSPRLRRQFLEAVVLELSSR
jgi:hypothetical protein